MSKALATKNVAAALVAAALVVGFSLAYATTAKAQTVTTTTTSAASYTFNLNEKLGARGAEVTQIQKFLNSNGFQIAKQGTGSIGNETNRFGSQTKQALIKFQEAHAKDILTPSGFTKGTGILLGALSGAGFGNKESEKVLKDIIAEGMEHGIAGADMSKDIKIMAQAILSSGATTSLGVKSVSDYVNSFITSPTQMGLMAAERGMSHTNAIQSSTTGLFGALQYANFKGVNDVTNSWRMAGMTLPQMNAGNDSLQEMYLSELKKQGKPLPNGDLSKDQGFLSWLSTNQDVKRKAMMPLYGVQDFEIAEYKAMGKNWRKSGAGRELHGRLVKAGINSGQLTSGESLDDRLTRASEMQNIYGVSEDEDIRKLNKRIRAMGNKQNAINALSGAGESQQLVASFGVLSISAGDAAKALKDLKDGAAGWYTAMVKMIGEMAKAMGNSDKVLKAMSDNPYYPEIKKVLEGKKQDEQNRNSINESIGNASGVGL